MKEDPTGRSCKYENECILRKLNSNLWICAANLTNDCLGRESRRGKKKCSLRLRNAFTKSPYWYIDRTSCHLRNLWMHAYPILEVLFCSINGITPNRYLVCTRSEVFRRNFKTRVYPMSHEKCLLNIKIVLNIGDLMYMQQIEKTWMTLIKLLKLQWRDNHIVGSASSIYEWAILVISGALCRRRHVFKIS